MICRRRVPFLSFVISPLRKIKINLAGCNFDCKGCFAIAKEEAGPSLSVEQLINLIKNSRSFFYGEEVCDVQITGGEPTLDKDYLISLINGLRKLNVERIGISTNGYLLDKTLIRQLKALNIDHIKLDIKAYTRQLHIDYTGKDNASVLKAARLLHEHALSFYVRTIFTPDLMGFEEIEKIAKFIGGVDKNIPYRIYQFAPEQLFGKVSRSPTDEEMRKAYAVAENYLKNLEYYTTETAYRPAPYKCIEVRADELLERFKKIDEISQAVIKDWNMKYFTIAEILNSKS